MIWKEIASADGVQISYALQAGREIRIMVHQAKSQMMKLQSCLTRVREQIERRI